MDIWTVTGNYGVTVLLASVVVTLLFVYNNWYYNRLRRYGIPGPKGWPILFNIIDVIKTGSDIETKWSKQYGDVYGWVFGQSLTIVVRDPDILKEILVKDFSYFTDRMTLPVDPHPVNKTLFDSRGSNWKRLRTIMSPTFSASKLKMMNGVINDCAGRLTENLENNVGEAVKVADYFGAFTLEVIAATAFGISVDTHKNKDDPFIAICKDLFLRYKFSPVIVLAFIFPIFCPLLRLLDQGFFKRKEIRFFNQQIEMMINQRKDDPNKRHDFLESLIDAELQEGQTNKKMSRSEIYAQSMIFFIAGYETTAKLLRFTSYILATHTDVQDRLVDEINQQLGEEEPRYENISRLEYMEQVLCEVLRLYPPVPSVTRVASETRTLKSITIPKGSMVNIPIFGLQRDERHYPDPEKFKPERFVVKSSQNNNIKFLAFGFGPRICIGMRLAFMEAKIALVHVLRKVQFSQGPKTEVPLKIHTFPFTNPINPIQIKIELRN